MTREALKLALEAYIKAGNGNSTDFYLQSVAYDLAIEALAQPEQEPVAWAYVNSDDECEQIEYCTESPMPEFVPLFTSPPRREWVGLTNEEYTNIAHRTASKYAHRTDPNFIAYTFLPHTLEHFVQLIEKTLKERNT